MVQMMRTDLVLLVLGSHVLHAIAHNLTELRHQERMANGTSRSRQTSLSRMLARSA